MSRDAILNRLRTTRRSQPPGQHPLTAPDPVGATPGLDAFVEAWGRLGGSWEIHANPAAARLALLLHLRTAEVRDLLVVSPDRLPLAGLDDALVDAGFHLIAAAAVDLAADYRMGLVGVDAALARTGSLVLAPDHGASWLPALLPERLVAVVLASQILPDLDAWRRACETSDRADSLKHALVISGPSASADLELQERRGFFGASRLHLIVLRD